MANLPVVPPAGPLPYGPLAQQVLGPLHRAFVRLNGVLAPLLDAGLGALISNPWSGYLMVLRTRGRRTGRIRSVPLGYVIVDGAIYCCAGFGAGTLWYRNLLADPSVEVVLPGRTLKGRAEPVTDAAEWIRAYRALMRSLGLVSRLAMGNLRRIDDETLLSGHRSLPLVRITPTGVVAGDLDPGGRFWLVSLSGWLLVAAVLAGRLRRPNLRRPIRLLQARHRRR
jgi:deazaflavin-dependent oxidoreductase (nitroreductase family)